jgi:hypothetical protein
LQIHLIELPKYILPDDNEPIGDPVDQWLFFFAMPRNRLAKS